MIILVIKILHAHLELFIKQNIANLYLSIKSQNFSLLFCHQSAGPRFGVRTQHRPEINLLFQIRHEITSKSDTKSNAANSIKVQISQRAIDPQIPHRPIGNLTIGDGVASLANVAHSEHWWGLDVVAVLEKGSTLHNRKRNHTYASAPDKGTKQSAWARSEKQDEQASKLTYSSSHPSFPSRSSCSCRQPWSPPHRRRCR